MKKIKLAVLTGGNSVESPSSYDSARDVISHLNKDHYEVYVVDIVDSNWWVKRNLEGDVIGQINQNDFTFSYNGVQVSFDCVFIVMHGGRGENGSIQRYFDLLNLPYTGSGVFASALCTDKYKCKRFLAVSTNVALPKGILINANSLNNQLPKAQIPSIVKPNCSGSSFGVSKVTNSAALKQSVELAMQYDKEVLVEEAIEGIEVTIGVMITKKGQEYVLAPTETHFEGDVFDTQSKLIQENTQLITPARISDKATQHCKQAALDVYRTIGCAGLVRIDFIVKNEVPYFLEVNTIPGMMLKSSIPRQILHSGIGLEKFYGMVVDDALSKPAQKATA